MTQKTHETQNAMSNDPEPWQAECLKELLTQEKSSNVKKLWNMAYFSQQQYSSKLWYLNNVQGAKGWQENVAQTTRKPLMQGGINPCCLHQILTRPDH